MLLQIDEHSSQPLYEQIAAAVRRAVIDGSAQPGDRLPSGRDLAESSGVTLETVQRAYRTLADDGIVVSRVGRGTSIRSDLNPAALSIDPYIDALIDQARLVGIDKDALFHRLMLAWQSTERPGRE